MLEVEEPNAGRTAQPNDRQLNQDVRLQPDAQRHECHDAGQRQIGHPNAHPLASPTGPNGQALGGSGT